MIFLYRSHYLSYRHTCASNSFKIFVGHIIIDRLSIKIGKKNSTSSQYYQFLNLKIMVMKNKLKVCNKYMSSTVTWTLVIQNSKMKRSSCAHLIEKII